MSQYRPSKGKQNAKLLVMESNNIQSQYLNEDPQTSPQFRNQDSNNEIAKLQLELEKNQNESSTFKYRLTELTKQVEEWRNRYLASQNENQTMLQELRSDIEMYQKEIYGLKQKQHDDQMEKNELNDMNAALRKEIEDWENGFNRLEDDYNDLKQTVDMHNLQAELDKITIENKTLEEGIADRDRAISQQKEQIDNLQMDLNQLQIDNEYSLDLLKQKEREIQQFENELDRNKETLRKQSDVSNKTETMQKEIIRLNSIIKQTHKDLQEAIEDKNQMEQELMGAKQNTEYQKKINLLGQEVERLNNILALKIRENNDYKQQITRMQREIQNLKMNEFKLQDLNISLDELILQYTQLKEDNQTIKQQLNQKQLKITNDQDQKFKQLIADNERINILAIQNRKEADYLREQLNNYSQIDDQLRQFKQSNDKLTEKNNQLELERQSLLQEYQLLSNSYNSQKFTYQQAQQESNDLSNQLQMAKLENQRLITQLKDVTEQLRNKNQISNEENSAQLNQATKTIQQLKKQNQQLQEQIDELIDRQEFASQQYNNDPELAQKLSQYEYRFPLLVEEIERLNRILTDIQQNKTEITPKRQQYDNNEYSFQKMENFNSDSSLPDFSQNQFQQEKIAALEAEIDRLKQTIILKQQQLDKSKDNQNIQDIVFKLQDENRRLANLISLRNNEIAELKINLQDYKNKQTLQNSSPQRYEQKIAMLNEEIELLTTQLQNSRNELNLCKIGKNDKFTEERGKILTQELDRQIQLNRENEKELMDFRVKFAQIVDSERKLFDCQCLLVLLYNEIERLNSQLV